MTIKPLNNSILHDIRFNGKDKELLYKEYGKSADIADYSDYEITLMSHGVYVDKSVIITDDNYCLDLSAVSEIVCSLLSVDSRKTSSKVLDNKPNFPIKSIKKFYVKGYFFETNMLTHDITNVLHKLGVLKKGKDNYKDLYEITNDYKILQKFKQGQFPKDLFYPIKCINDLFFSDDYYLSNFIVKSDFLIS